MAARNNDPSATLRLRNALVAQFTRRFANIARVLLPTLENLYAAKSSLSVLATIADQTEFDYKGDAAKLQEFRRWLDKQIQIEIFDDDVENLPDWISKPLHDAYGKGIHYVREFLQSQLESQGATYYDANFLLNPYHRYRMEVIWARAFTQVVGITDNMQQQLAEILTSAMLKGINPVDAANEMKAKISGIQLSKARVLARTEIVLAHSLASLQQMKNFEELLGVEIKARWQTALDGRERPSHRARHGNIYTQEEVAPLLGEPNCRCSLAPHLPGFTPAKDAQKK